MFKSKRPTYAILLFALASLWMCGAFLPFLYSLVFPNKDIQRVVSALEQRSAAPPEATTAVEETLSAVGPLTRAIPIAYSSGVTTTLRAGGSHTIWKKEASYLAWFEQRRKATVLVVTTYENDEKGKTYEIGEGEETSYLRSYGLPTLVFGGSLALLRKRKPPQRTV